MGKSWDHHGIICNKLSHCDNGMLMEQDWNITSGVIKHEHECLEHPSIKSIKTEVYGGDNHL